MAACMRLAGQPRERRSTWRCKRVQRPRAVEAADKAMPESVAARVHSRVEAGIQPSRQQQQCSMRRCSCALCTCRRSLVISQKTCGLVQKKSGHSVLVVAQGFVGLRLSMKILQNPRPQSTQERDGKKKVPLPLYLRYDAIHVQYAHDQDTEHGELRTSCHAHALFPFAWQRVYKTCAMVP